MPCLGAVPHLLAVEKELKDEPVTFLMVTDEAPERIEKFLAKRRKQERPMPGWVVVDSDKSTLSVRDKKPSAARNSP